MFYYKEGIANTHIRNPDRFQIALRLNGTTVVGWIMDIDLEHQLFICSVYFVQGIWAS